ncbi:hypothetical protein UA08_04175 [Talaromyces atroroseus]|uniref:DUF3074 domain-containing protein n=1 Tax=Talaromyces atroroseus TaxID=1441469 RepID=A0A1Q5Q8C3_TALAT|nr:hypothetical protein UA08_04175 [Talaromyces atroroseus]OKL60361.1 hypothetical protein UA08_04175 [Talaromyces atroroseus]
MFSDSVFCRMRLCTDTELRLEACEKTVVHVYNFIPPGWGVKAESYTLRRCFFSKKQTMVIYVYRDKFSMAELHEALSYLKPTPWAEVPRASSSTELHKYAREILNKARLIVETVPEQNPSSASLSDIGTSAASITKKPKSSTNEIHGNGNGNGSLLLLSQSRLDSLRKEWGKPLKMNNAKENPLNVPVYKLGGKDGKGAWFARRSVHKGLPFSRWKGKMQAEMEESLRARQEEIRQGRTPEMSIRGIGGDRKLEKIDIRGQSQAGNHDIKMLSDETNDDPPLPPTYIIVSKPCEHPNAPPQDNYIRGQYESVELIRELPIEKSTKQKPTTSMLTTGDEEVDEDAPNPVEWIMITRSDPGGSVPKWLVERGTPKSITGDTVKFLNWASKPDLLGEGADTADIGELTEMTESAGNNRRLSRLSRLSSKDGIIVADQQPDAVDTGIKGAKHLDQSLDGVEDDGNNVEDEQQENSNIWSNVTKMVHTGLHEYAPKAVLNYIPGSLSPSQDWGKEDNSDNIGVSTKESKSEPDDDEFGEAEETRKLQIDEANDTSSLASDDSFTSADSHVSSSASTPQVYDGQDQSQSASAMASEAALGVTPALNDATGGTKRKLSSKEKELAKLNARKNEAQVKLASVRSEICELGGLTASNGKNDLDIIHRSGEPFNNNNLKNEGKEKSSTSVNNANANATFSAATQQAIAAQNQKRTESLLRTESKLISRLNKIEARQTKANKKLEAHQRKAAGRAEKSRSRSEMDSLRKENASLRQEMRELREEREKWLDIVGRMQKENSRLIAEARKSAGKEGGYGTD